MSVQPETTEGPYRGSKCVAGPDGRWERATIRRVNEDGTFNIEPDEKPMLVMPNWYGVTPSEVSFDDVGRWPTVLARLTGGVDRLNEADFAKALSSLGYLESEEDIRRFWVETCTTHLGLSDAQASRAALDAGQAYALCLRAGVSAKRLDEALTAGPVEAYYKLYWNLTRMGGRDPTEVRRAVTLDDAIIAVGAAEREINGDAVARLRSFEVAQGIRLPDTLKSFFTRSGIEKLVLDSHPNNPELVTVEQKTWKLRSDMRDQGLSADLAITVMLPHQGDHKWVAIFNNGDQDAQIYVRWKGDMGDVWRLTAPTVGMFFWDLAQTGLAWYREREFERSPPTIETDIGLAVGH